MIAPVITIDGPSGTGKGAVAGELARRLGWHQLDSGVLYRAVGLAAERRGLNLAVAGPLVRMVEELTVEFHDGWVAIDGDDVTDLIRTEAAGAAASKVAAHRGVREVLLTWQRAAARHPGLVADGRDMGSVVFPQAILKVYLTASPEVRAERRYNQLKEKGMDVNLASLVAEIRARDERDRTRSVAPLVIPPGAFELDTTTLSLDAVVSRVWDAASVAVAALRP